LILRPYYVIDDFKILAHIIRKTQAIKKAASGGQFKNLIDVPKK